jgi:hypothetical protein
MYYLQSLACRGQDYYLRNIQPLVQDDTRSRVLCMILASGVQYDHLDEGYFMHEMQPR